MIHKQTFFLKVCEKIVVGVFLPVKQIVMNKSLRISTATAGIFAVIIGAFGAHGLKPMLNQDQLILWEKGVQYHFYHSLAMLTCMLYLGKEYSRMVNYAAWCFLSGIICFSGSLYLLATRHLTEFPAAILGPITPIGGFLFIAGWGLILVNAIRSESAA